MAKKQTKKTKKEVSSEEEEVNPDVEDIDESYYSESGDSINEIGEKSQPIDYEQFSASDSSDDDSDGSDQQALDANLIEQKEAAEAMNKTWGQQKTGFYGRNKENDDESDTSDDADELEQAERLASIRARKMKIYMQKEEENFAKTQNEKIGGGQAAEESAGDDEESDSDDQSQDGTKKIGDKLFAEEESTDLRGKITSQNLREFAKDMDPQLLKQLLETESPELNPMLSELEETMNQINNMVSPVLEKLKVVKLHKNSFFRTKGGRQYLEMKHNLLLSYSTFLVFYLMLKAEGRDVKNHPVVYKLAHIRTLLDKLRPIDEKINIEIAKVMKATALMDDEAQSYGDSDENEEIQGRNSDQINENASEDQSGMDDQGDMMMPDEGEDAELGGDLTKAQIRELQEVVKANQRKQALKAFEADKNNLSSGELKKQAKLHKKSLKSKLANLDDMDDIVAAFKSDKPDKKLAAAAAVSEKPKVMKHAEQVYKDDKDNKSKKQKARELAEAEQLPEKKRKMKFEDLKTAKNDGDDVYQAQAQKLRDRKAERKENAKDIKRGISDAVDRGTAQIQRNVQKDILLNRGLTRQRKKVDRNPRVKKRMKYEKMEKIRKNVVREYKDGEYKVYQGESSGIKKSLDRGIKFQ